jgi:hypothetical protein
MTGVRFADVQARPAEFLNLTSLTLEEFEVLVAPFIPTRYAQKLLLRGLLSEDVTMANPSLGRIRQRYPIMY